MNVKHATHSFQKALLLKTRKQHFSDHTLGGLSVLTLS